MEKNVLLKIALDFVIILIVGLPIIAFYIHLKPYRRGFFCDDDSIRHPYKYSTISDVWLYSVGICVPVLIIGLTEIINNSRSDSLSLSQNSPTISNYPIPPVIWRMYKVIGVFLFGACVTELTTDIAKYMIGRLRPHFIDVCQPDIDCSNHDQHVYIDTYRCTGKDIHKIIDARQSFPSGHSSFSAYTVLFTVIYLQRCMSCSSSKLFRPFLQFLLSLAAICTCLTRISDYKHHWSDVLAGFIFGIVVACATVFGVSDLFTEETKKPSNVFQMAPRKSIVVFRDESDIEKKQYVLDINKKQDEQNGDTDKTSSSINEKEFYKRT